MSRALCGHAKKITVLHVEDEEESWPGLLNAVCLGARHAG